MTRHDETVHRISTPNVSYHPTALCESDDIGGGTRIWAYAHVMNNAHIGTNCNICDHVFIESGVHIGDRVTVKNQALLYTGVTIEDDVFVGPGVAFTNDRYPRSARMPEAAPRYRVQSCWLERTTVEHGVSIGAGAIVLCGTRIGAYATIGAGAIVTRDVAPHALVIGQPARQIGWVCTCGIGLDESLACPDCHLRFVKDGDTIRTESRSSSKQHDKTRHGVFVASS